MYSMIIRTTIMFLIVMSSARIMGKKNLGEFQPSDLVATMLISNLTSTVIESPELPLIYSIVPIVMIACYEVFTSVAVKKSKKIADITQGTSKILIFRGVINQKVMQELRFTIDDVLEALRNKDIFYIEEVQLAIVETTGVVNVYPDPNADKNVKKSDIPPFPVISDCNFLIENFEFVKTNKEKINKILKKEKTNLNEVLLLLIDGDGNYNMTIKEKLWNISI